MVLQALLGLRIRVSCLVGVRFGLFFGSLRALLVSFIEDLDHDVLFELLFL